MAQANEVFSFEVSVTGTNWTKLINARSAGKAKADYWRDVLECWDVPFTAMRVRKIGRPESTEQFIRNAAYRGLPDVRCGDRVRVGTSLGTIVGHNSSANFDVLFDDDAPRFAGLRLNVHPSDCVILEPNQ
jgi:hypothetical protein